MDINEVLCNNKQNYFSEVIENFNESDKEQIALELENREEKIDNIKPITYIDQNNIANKERYFNIGTEALKRNEYAIVILAGGQGTRLGFNGPKGIYKIFPDENITFFSLYIEKIKKIEEKYSCKVPLYIMTSKKNNNETVKYFEENKYFNRKEYIRFFVQDELPMFLENKNLIVDENRQIKFASNGHGNVFIA